MTEGEEGVCISKEENKTGALFICGLFNRLGSSSFEPSLVENLFEVSLWKRPLEIKRKAENKLKGRRRKSSRKEGGRRVGISRVNEKWQPRRKRDG